jgi:RNase adapter protein RapZ
MGLSILLITGQSGSGKSTVIRALEDQGYYCIDNMPTPLVEDLVRLLSAEGGIERLALVMDIRDRRFIEGAPRLVRRLREGAVHLRVVYLDAKEEALVRRYSETRRRHPLDDGRGLRQAIASERELLTPLRELADDTLDTSAMSPHELRARVITQISGTEARDTLRVALVSFGFKYGLPLEADMVLDVRFLPNPYFEPSMKDRTGLDDDVSRYAIATREGAAFLQHTESFLRFLIPEYVREGKRYFTIAIGCTGGQHRSVAVARALATRLQDVVQVDLRHRDIRLPDSKPASKETRS